MFRVEYVYTADPLVDLIRRSPHEIFRRPYAGYLIFLFAKADACVANWMRDELISLDSLTGPDIAGVVFAKRVTIPVTVMYRETPRPSRSTIDHYHGTVDLNDVEVRPGYHPEYYFTKPMVEHGGLEWDDSVQELEAVTYATDEIARAFDVVSNLPCLIVADAVPTKEVEVIPLRETALSRIIPVLRNAIGNFLTCSNVSGHLVHLKALEHLSDAHEKLMYRLSGYKYHLSARVIAWRGRAGILSMGVSGILDPH